MDERSRVQITPPPHITFVLAARAPLDARSQHGILITTGHCTTDARSEASRPGARLVDFVDGCLLAEKRKELGLDVDVSSQETVRLRSEFFASI
ncbi:MAG: hypothetical protein HY556_05895 [Euryarchaeota archaeon]|nr:hypothetical protein [Euryarchaeota archaeon]